MKVRAICSKCRAQGVVADDQILTSSECCIDGKYLFVSNINQTKKEAEKPKVEKKVETFIQPVKKETKIPKEKNYLKEISGALVTISLFLFLLLLK